MNFSKLHDLFSIVSLVSYLKFLLETLFHSPHLIVILFQIVAVRALLCVYEI